MSKRDQVRAYLLKELRAGHREPGSVFLSENEVIRQSGFCKNTVREAFSTLVSDGILERIKGKGTFVRDLTMLSARRLSAARVVHLIIGNPTGMDRNDPFIGRFLLGLHSTLDPNGWQIQVKFVRPSSALLPEIRKIAAEIPSGDRVILAGFDYSGELTDIFRKADISLLTVGRPEAGDIPYVEGDNARLTYDAVTSLVRRGHRRIALADRRLAHAPSFDSRREGYIRALSDHGLVPDARLMAEFHKFDIEAGYEAWETLNRYGRDFTALICCGHQASCGVIQCARRDGIRIPEELSLISICVTPVTTSGYPVERYDFPSLAEQAGEFLLRHEQGDPAPNLLVLPVLFPGKSVRDINGQ